MSTFVQLLFLDVEFTGKRALPGEEKKGPVFEIL